MVFAGPGNNGGDGLALARLLSVSGYTVEVYYVSTGRKESEDFIINRGRLEKSSVCPVTEINDDNGFPLTMGDDVIIDAILGTGLSGKTEGLAASVIRMINDSGCEIVSVDIPSGMQGEDIGSAPGNAVVKAAYTLTFQFPKLSFMFHDGYKFAGEWFILPIGLHHEIISRTETPYHFLEQGDIVPLIRNRKKFDHKGTYGHGLLVAGSFNKAGAAVLAARAALRTGAGLITCHVPAGCVPVIQTAIPEAMVQADNNDHLFTSVTDFSHYSALAVGPGIGTSPETYAGFMELIKAASQPLVIDADGLNILGMNKDWISLLRPGTILTPHPKEFERLAGTSSSDFERLQKQISFSVKQQIIIVLKGAHSSISLPDGAVYFNSTGNPGMATAGSGDVLTGIILSLLSQGYEPAAAAIAGVYIHGLAGDIAKESMAMESIMATDITENISNVFRMLKGLETKK